ncbi:helix-turn-helix domain-containing protein [Ureibacillus sp. GCM10028918]|uniref:helix-turn-helix domain-containing protein n=1 Tax=Ureibacillus sp. GCM10028918 TaxID=3273429 RepID=UPI00361AB673
MSNEKKICETIPSPLGNRIKSLRKKNHLTQELLADQLGVSHAYIGFLEKGTRNGSNPLLKKMAEYFNIDSNELIHLRDQKDFVVQIDQNQEKKRITTTQTYPDYIIGFMELLSKIEETACKRIIEEFKGQLQKQLYQYLTPYDLPSVKKMVMDVKRNWINLIQQKVVQEPFEPLNKELNGYFLHQDKEVFFNIYFGDLTLIVSLLYPEQSHISIFENWLGEYSIRYLNDKEFTHLTQPQRVATFIWYSPANSTLDKYKHLLDNGIQMDRVQCTESQLNWYIQQFLKEEKSNQEVSAS